MKDLISCFGEQAVQVADCSSSSSSSRAANKMKSAHNAMFSAPFFGDSSSKMVSNVYHLTVAGNPLVVSVTWCNQALAVDLGDQDVCYSAENSCRSLWRKKKGFKRLEMGGFRIDVSWDISNARFSNGPEPTEGYHVTLIEAEGGEVLLHLGDDHVGIERCGSLGGFLICRKEHVYGKGFYSGRTRLCREGSWHDLLIECQIGDGSYVMRLWVDRDLVLKVRHLKWNFRGNQTLTVDGFDVDLFWDVHGWFFGNGHGVFMFKSSAKSFSLLFHAWKND